jgi:hypothetical protein
MLLIYFHFRKENIYNGRLEYNRMKTKAKRRDRAFISIKITDEMKPILEKYIGKAPSTLFLLPQG